MVTGIAIREDGLRWGTWSTTPTPTATATAISAPGARFDHQRDALCDSKRAEKVQPDFLLYREEFRLLFPSVVPAVACLPPGGQATLPMARSPPALRRPFSARDLRAAQEVESRQHASLAARLEGGVGSVGGLAPLAAWP